VNGKNLKKFEKEKEKKRKEKKEKKKKKKTVHKSSVSDNHRDGAHTHAHRSGDR